MTEAPATKQPGGHSPGDPGNHWSPRLTIAADEQFLPARRVWERYGVTSMSLYRWLKDSELGFPKPTYIGRFRYWNAAELSDWERRRASKRGA